MTGNSMTIFHDMAQNQDDETHISKLVSSKKRRQKPTKKSEENGRKRGSDSSEENCRMGEDDDIGEYMMRKNYFVSRN